MNRKEKQILRILNAQLEGGIYGLHLARQMNIATGTMAAHLMRLQREGHVESKWEGEFYPSEQSDKPEGATQEHDQSSGSRRRYYRITPQGRQALTDSESSN